MESEIRLTTIAPIEQIAVAIENVHLSAQQMLATCQEKADQAAAVAEVFVDIQENIRRSTERWLAYHQASMAQISEGMISSVAHCADMMAAAAASFERYCKEEAPETCTLLWQAGWVGMDHHFSIPQLRESVLLHKEEGEAAMNDGILAYFNEDNCALLESISRHWLRIPYLRDREQIIRDAVYAHKNGLFTLSIPTRTSAALGLHHEQWYEVLDHLGSRPERDQLLIARRILTQSRPPARLNFSPIEEKATFAGGSCFPQLHT